MARVTDRRLLDAVVTTVIASGYRGATTRQIAQAAGVNEVTLFRRFGDKRSLVLAAVHDVMHRVGEVDVTRTDDAEADLAAVVRYCSRVLAEQGDLAIALATEAARDRELAEVIGEPLGALRRVAGLIEHHRAEGRLVDRPAAEAAAALIGPLLGARLMRAALGEDAEVPPADVGEIVTRFLEGWAPRPSSALAAG